MPLSQFFNHSRLQNPWELQKMFIPSSGMTSFSSHHSLRVCLDLDLAPQPPQADLISSLCLSLMVFITQTKIINEVIIYCLSLLLD